jgi:hypothetical protein
MRFYAPGSLMLGTIQTAADGSYSFQFSPANQDGTFEVIGYYAGNDSFWPAQARECTLPPLPRLRGFLDVSTCGPPSAPLPVPK